MSNTAVDLTDFEWGLVVMALTCHGHRTLANRIGDQLTPAPEEST